MQRYDDAQQHESPRDTDSDAVDEGPISSPPQHSGREDHLVDLFKAQMSPALMKSYVDSMGPRPEGASRKKARKVSYSESTGDVGNGKSIGLSEFTYAERKLLDLYCRKGWSAAEGEEVLQLLRDPMFRASDIKSVAFRNLLTRLDRGESAPQFHCLDFWVEEDGDQEVKMYFRDFKDVFLEIITDENVGAVDLFSRPRFDDDGNRWFTAHANSGEWWEEVQEKVGWDTAIGAGKVFFDGAHILQNVGINAGYGMSKHLLCAPFYLLTPDSIRSWFVELNSSLTVSRSCMETLDYLSQT